MNSLAPHTASLFLSLALPQIRNSDREKKTKEEGPNSSATMSSSDIEMYGLSSTPELFHIDDLLDFSNEDLFSSSSAITTTDTSFHLPLPATETTTATDPTDNFLCVPNDDIAELEWLSNFVDEDSFSNFSLTNLPTNTGTTSTTNTNTNTTTTTISVPGKARSKRPKPTTLTHHGWTTSSSESDISAITKSTTSRISNKNRGERDRERDLVSSSSSSSRLMRKCSHCASEKTPQWRTGPMGPKTLCNACGVRYKSGRLVPEYRPAASPTFVLTRHSNSHRKVMELRRQKEEEVVVMDMDMEDNNNCHEFFRHHRDFKVC